MEETLFLLLSTYFFRASGMEDILKTRLSRRLLYFLLPRFFQEMLCIIRFWGCQVRKILLFHPVRLRKKPCVFLPHSTFFL